MDLTALRAIQYGMFIISSHAEEKMNGQIANTVFQISPDPATVAISINKQNLTHEYISKSKVFTITVLSQETPMEFIGLFGFKSGKNIDKFKGMDHTAGTTGAPIVTRYAVAVMEAEVIAQIDVFTHTIFVGKLVDAKKVSDAVPMTYQYYHEIKGGLTPKNAATYQKTEQQPHKEAQEMKKYTCNVCGYVYDPAKGDPDGGIAPGTPFEQIPDTWVCPVCGAPKSEFTAK